MQTFFFFTNFPPLFHHNAFGFKENFQHESCSPLQNIQLLWFDIYGLILINRCIATSVVEARVCDYRDLGSSPSGTLLDFSHIFHILTFFWQRWDSPLGPHVFFTSDPLVGYSHHGPFYFYFSHFYLLVFLNSLSNTKKIRKNI